MREASLEQSLRIRLQNIGCLFYKFVSPGNNGVPDRICITPDGRVIFVELKTARGNLRSDQRVQIRRLSQHHVRTVVIYGPDDAANFVREIAYWEKGDKRERKDRRR